MIRRSLLAVLTRYLGGLRYPWLFGITATLLAVDLLVPDVVPFVDELLLAAVTLLLGSRQKDRPEEIDTGDAGDG